MTISELKSLLGKFHIHPDKSLGQNFLLSERVIEQIVTAAELKNTDSVLEIGPGLGILTRALGEGAGSVLAIEKDKKIAFALRKIFSSQGRSASGGKSKKNVKIIQGDALFIREFEFGSRNSEHTNSQLPSPSFKVVANIPYYITGKLLQNFLTARQKPSLMVLLLQKEVAERITAKPGNMSILSVSVQFYADPEIISIVSREDFYPKPEVDSAVVRLRVLPQPRFAVDEKKFFQLVKIGFSNKRKMLKNNLASHFSIAGEELEQTLSSLAINPLARAQDLSLADWKKVYDKIYSQKRE